MNHPELLVMPVIRALTGPTMPRTARLRTCVTTPPEIVIYRSSTLAIGDDHGSSNTIEMPGDDPVVMPEMSDGFIVAVERRSADGTLTWRREPPEGDEDSWSHVCQRRLEPDPGARPAEWGQGFDRR